MTLPISLFVPLHLRPCFLISLNSIKFKIMTLPLPLFLRLLLVLDPQSFELDKVKRPMYNCLKDKIKNCEKKGAQGTLEFEECILKAHRKCLIRHRYRKKMTSESSHCLLDCFEYRSHEIGSCFLECYEKYFKTQ